MERIYERYGSHLECQDCKADITQIVKTRQKNCLHPDDQITCKKGCMYAATRYEGPDSMICQKCGMDVTQIVEERKREIEKKRVENCEHHIVRISLSRQQDMYKCTKCNISSYITRRNEPRGDKLNLYGYTAYKLYLDQSSAQV